MEAGNDKFDIDTTENSSQIQQQEMEMRSSEKKSKNCTQHLFRYISKDVKVSKFLAASD
jgi:hypothetical protein